MQNEHLHQVHDSSLSIMKKTGIKVQSRRALDLFSRADGDKDGVLVLVELQKIDEDMVFEPADANNDGKVVLTEYVDQRFESFHETDVNSNGLLSAEEVIDAYEGP